MMSKIGADRGMIEGKYKEPSEPLAIFLLGVEGEVCALQIHVTNMMFGLVS